MIEVHGPDEIRGHIAITRDGVVVATACDMGPHLNLWTPHGVDLTPQAAQDLARALNAWAERGHAVDTRHPDEVLLETIESAYKHTARSEENRMSIEWTA